MHDTLSGHFTVARLIRYTLPTVGMMISTSVYWIADGFFISNFVGETGFAAVNLVMPMLTMLICVSFMYGAGGSALIGKTLGEGNRALANRHFSMVVAACLVTGAVLAAAGWLLLAPVVRLFGVEEALLQDCLLYARILMPALPFVFVQDAFHSLFSAAGKPGLGFAATMTSGLMNVVLDALFIVAFGWGLTGAAAATVLSQLVGGLLPIVYFSRPNSSLLRFVRPVFDGKALMNVCFNGSSEVVSEVSWALVGMLYNYQLLKYAGQAGVAVFGVLMYVGWVFMSIFYGFSMGAAPVVSYHFGAGNRQELRSLLRKSGSIIAVLSVAMLSGVLLFAEPISQVFVGYSPDLTAMTQHAFSIFSWMYLLCGFCIFGSGFFTALGDGVTSAWISVLRTLVFETAAVLILPVYFGPDGIWSSMLVAEVAAFLVTAACLIARRERFGY